MKIMIIIAYDDGVIKEREDIMKHSTHIDANSVVVVAVVVGRS